MREKTVEVVLIDGSTWYIPQSEFIHFNVPEDPIAILSNLIRGSRGPFVVANSLEDMTGEKRHINANYILTAKVVYNS